MTTITKFTKEQLTERARRKVKELEFAIAQSAFTSIRDGLKEELELARIALASLEAEPVAYIFKHPAGELFWSLTDESNKGQNDVMPVYAAQPVQETGVYKDMLNIIGLLEKNEWAEHCTNTVLGSLLESEITRLVGKKQPAPVVPEECPAELPYAQVKAAADLFALCWQSGEVVTYTPDPEKATIWLNNYSGTCVQEYVKLERLQEALAGNSPVTPDGYALVPVEPTDEMINAALKSHLIVFNPVETYSVMLAAAPKPELTSE
ncbi:TPA: DUF551 domain-containing protein [Salmonella enterica subsp. enterica serovar Muenchen]